jgi:molecular chaperone HscB
VHPDRTRLFGLPQRQGWTAALDAATALPERSAMQWAVRVNEAYQRLKDPLRRAAYLCELRGVPIDAENNTAMPAPS